MAKETHSSPSRLSSAALSAAQTLKTHTHSFVLAAGMSRRRKRRTIPPYILVLIHWRQSFQIFSSVTLCCLTKTCFCSFSADGLVYHNISIMTWIFIVCTLHWVFCLLLHVFILSVTVYQNSVFMCHSDV